MTRGLLHLLSWVAATVLASGSAHAQLLPVAAGASAPSPFVATHPTLRASLERIARRSALWREAAESIQKAGRRAVVVTAEQVVVTVTADEPSNDTFDTTVLAEVAPILRADSSLDLALVVVNLDLLEEQHRERQLPWVEFERDLDRILVHEIYGHAVPYLLAGHISGRCPDPQARERPTDACSIKRENAVRAELGLGRRVDYGLDGLSLARGSRR